MPQHEGTAWIARNWPELRRFDGRWIGASANGVEADGGTYVELLEGLAEKDVARRGVIAMYVWFGAFA